MIKKARYFFIPIVALALAGCGAGSGGSPTSETPIAGDALGFATQASFQAGPTISTILANPAAFFGQQVTLQGMATQQLSPGSFYSTTARARCLSIFRRPPSLF